MIDGMWVQWLLYIDLFVLGVIVTVTIQHWYNRVRGSSHKPDPRMSVLSKSDKQDIIKDAREQFQRALDATADRLEHDLKVTTDRISAHLEELGNETADAENKRYQSQLNKLFSHAETDVDAARKATKKHIATQQELLATLHEQAQADIEKTKDSVADYGKHYDDKMQLIIAQATKTIEDSNQDIVDYKQRLKDRLEELEEQAQKQVEDVTQEIDEYKQQLKVQLADEVKQQQQKIAQQMDQKLTDTVVAFLSEAMQHNVDLGAQADYLTKVLEENKKTLIKGVAGETKASK